MYLHDIRDAAQHVAEFTAGKQLADYQSDVLLRSAVERQFEIICEAASQLAGVDASLATALTDYPRVVAFRNILIHRYRDIDHEIVWRVIEFDLPRLREEVTALLADA